MPRPPGKSKKKVVADVNRDDSVGDISLQKTTKKRSKTSPVVNGVCKESASTNEHDNKPKSEKNKIIDLQESCHNSKEIQRELLQVESSQQLITTNSKLFIETPEPIIKEGTSSALIDTKLIEKLEIVPKNKSKMTKNAINTNNNNNVVEVNGDVPSDSVESSVLDRLKEEHSDNSKIITNLNCLSINKDLQAPILQANKEDDQSIEYVQYQSELQMPMIMKIIQKDLSEPYSIYTYRYFIHNWPNLCFLAMCGEECVGAIVCKLDLYHKVIKRGYIAMLAVDKKYRKHGIGSTLVRRAIQEMVVGDADEVVLETEITNKPALRLYEALGFVRDKRLFRYYLNGVDALRLKLWLR